MTATYGMGMWAVSPPVSQPLFPGTATGTDAAVINAIVAILSGYGLCAAS